MSASVPFELVIEVEVEVELEVEVEAKCLATKGRLWCWLYFSEMAG